MAKQIPYNRRYLQNQQAAPETPDSEPAPAPPPRPPVPPDFESPFAPLPLPPEPPWRHANLEARLRALSDVFTGEDVPQIAEEWGHEPPEMPIEEPASVVLEVVQLEGPAPLSPHDADNAHNTIAAEDAPPHALAHAPADYGDDLFDPVALVQAYLVEEPIHEEAPISARFESRCIGCGEMIHVGEPIARHPQWGRYVHAHCRTRQQPAALSAMTARYAGLCRACRQPIVPGERIVQMPPFGWVHAACAERHARES